MKLALAPKMVECQCGNTFEATQHKTWCQKCCRPVFYHEKDQRRYKMNNIYMVGVMAMVMMFIAYIFIEMIAAPLMSMH